MQYKAFSKVVKKKETETSKNQSLDDVIESMKLLEKFEVTSGKEQLNRFKLKKSIVLKKVEKTNR